MTLDVLEGEEAPIVDTHAHQPTATFLEDAGGEMMADAARRFGTDLHTWSYEEMIEEYREAGIGRAVLLGWDAETNTGNPPVPNEHVAEIRDEHPEFFIGFASVDPLKDDCVETAERAVEDLGLSGFKFQQIAQGFDPSDPEHEPLWSTIEDLGVPVVFHGGNSTLGAGAPGGRGLHVKYGDPMLIDDVAARHPELQILIAHPAFPWEREQLAVCQQKGNERLHGPLGLAAAVHRRPGAPLREDPAPGQGDVRHRLPDDPARDLAGVLRARHRLPARGPAEAALGERRGVPRPGLSRWYTI